MDLSESYVRELLEQTPDMNMNLTSVVVDGKTFYVRIESEAWANAHKRVKGRGGSMIALALVLMGCALARSQGALPAASNPYQVNLACAAPASSADPVAGYAFLRAASGSTSYAQLNSTAATACAYIDKTAAAGATWDYTAESVDAAGNKSAASNMAPVTIPAALAAGTLTGTTT